MPDVTYPTNAELRRIEQVKLPRLTQDRAIFNIFPITTVDAPVLMWEQEDNYTGLQQVRGLNGDPPRVKHTGAKRYVAAPGIYGEFEPIDEAELTMRRGWGEWSGSVSIDDLVMRLQDKLLGRRLDRIEYIGWTFLTTGTFAVAGPSGAILHTDQITLTTYTPGVTWSTSATATPLKDFRNVKLLGRGKSVDFGARARAYLNQVTLNRMMSNTNQNDLAGRRVNIVQNVLNMAEINTILQGESLPQVVPYDEGYLNDAGTFVPYIPDGVVVLVGVRADGNPIGEYRMTRNAQNPGMAPGAYQFVADSMAGPNPRPPRRIEVHDGHNGGPVVFYPSAIIVMNVG
jgi:hypothetical protein